MVQVAGLLAVTNTDLLSTNIVGDTTNVVINGRFLVGDTGQGSYRLNNGTVVTVRGIVGNTGSGQGTLTISGAGVLSNWATAVGTLTVGNGSFNNRLIVTNGGKLFTGVAGAGFNTSSNNVILVTGSGSVWDAMNNDVRCGFGFGAVSNNAIIIADGGVFTNVARVILADNSAGMANKLIISSGAKLFANGSITVGAGGGNSGNLFQVGSSGAACFVTNRGVLVGLGVNAQSNVMIVTNATMLSSADSGVGGQSGFGASGSNAVNNLATITSGALWDLGNATLRIGAGGAAGVAGSSNTLVITGGGIVTNVQRFFLSDNNTGVGNQLIVTNGGKLFLLNTGTSAIGQSGFGSGNRVVCAGGGFISSGNITIGNAATTNNSILITGSGSVWNMNNAALRAGAGGTAGHNDNVAIITAGGVLTNVGGTFICDNAAGNANGVIVSDGGRFFSSGEVRVGTTVNSSNSFYLVGGIGASSVVSNGGTVSVGFTTGSQFNRLVVTNASFNCGNLNVGNNATAGSNTVSILAGATVDMRATRINFGGFGGALTIQAGIVTNCGEVIVGNSAHFNTLIITNGGRLYSGAAGTLWNIGRSTGSNNLVVVAGGGATWDAGGQSVVIGQQVGGILPSNNTVIVSAGGVFTNGSILVADGGNEQLIMDGGKIAVSQLRVFPGQTATFSSGTLEFSNLRVDGTMAGSAPITVANGATLQGVGSIANPVIVADGGILAPGDSVGTLSLGSDLVLNSASVLNYEMGSLTNYDQTLVAGNLTLDGVLNITTNTTDGLFGVGDYVILTYGGSLINNGLLVGSTPDPSLSYSIEASGGAVILHVASAPSDPYTAWTSFYGLSGGNAAGNADPDGDGMINTNEFLAGFNPTNSSAYLRIISLTRSGSDMVVTYLGSDGDSNGSPGPKTNVLEFTTGSGSGGYSNNFVSTGQTNILTGGTGLGVVTNMTDAGGATGPARYYRVRVLTP